MRWWQTRFTRVTAGAVVVGAMIRALYLAFFPSTVVTLVSGDGFGYSVGATLLADGDGYVDPLNGERPNAHHPPGWVTTLAAATKFGWRSFEDHQRVGALVGLALIVVTAVVARRLFGDVVGMIAAGIAACYPGFWVIEAQILSEPLGLVLGGLVVIALYRLHERPDLRRAAELGFLVGASALVRSEQLLVAAIVLPPLLFRTTLAYGRRLAVGATAATVALALLAPWAAHNTARFEKPVLLSTNLGTTLLTGNCPTTYSGERWGFYDPTCVRQRLAAVRGDRDRSVQDAVARGEALDNIVDNIDRIPPTVLARHGRTLAVFRPSQTVEFVASWHGTETWPVWLWVGSFWLLVPLAVVGMLDARRRGGWLLPLVAPVLVVIAVVTIFFGEPRYHTPADLSVVVLAATGVASLAERHRSATDELTTSG